MQGRQAASAQLHCSSQCNLAAPRVHSCQRRGQLVRAAAAPAPRDAAPQQPKQAAAALAAVVAASALQMSVASTSFAAPVYDNLPGFGAQTPFAEMVEVERRAQAGKDIDDLFDENLMTASLKDFVDNVQNNKLQPEQYDSERLKLNFRRGIDGRVELRSRQGRWFGVRPDMQVPGYLLIRESSGGRVYYLQPDEWDALAQLDLSDDVVVAELFSNTAWQDVMRPLILREDGKDEQVRLSEQQFRNVVTLLDSAEEVEVAPAK